MSLDVIMGSDGDLPAFTRHAYGDEAIGQRLGVRLRTHVGDWPLDTTAGVDWVGFLGTKPADLEGFSASLVLEALAVPGVDQVVDLAWAQTGDAAEISFTILTSLGTELPVIVQPQDAAGNLSIVVGGLLVHSGTVIA